MTTSVGPWPSAPPSEIAETGGGAEAHAESASVAATMAARRTGWMVMNCRDGSTGTRFSRRINDRPHPGAQENRTVTDLRGLQRAGEAIRRILRGRRRTFDGG